MDLASIRPLLRLSDRHPLGCHNREELGVACDIEFHALLTSGVLVERAPPSLVDGAIVMRRDGRTYLVPADPAEELEEVDGEALHLYDIDLDALSILLRKGLGLSGAPAVRITPFLFWLGARSSGTEREGVYLARGRSSDHLLGLLGIARVHDPAPRLTVLTPTDWVPSASVFREIKHYDGRVLSLHDQPVSVGSGMVLPPFSESEGRAPRLTLNTDGASASLDGLNLRLARRELAVLVALAREAKTDGGFVSSEHLAGALVEATGTEERNPLEQVTNVVSRLRQALGDKGLIEMRRKTGYRLVLGAEEIDVF